MTFKERDRLIRALQLEFSDDSREREEFTFNDAIKSIRWLRKMVARGDRFVHDWEEW